MSKSIIDRRRGELTCSEKEDANMVNRTGIWELEIRMSFVDLLEVCLQKTTGHAASEHDVLVERVSLESVRVSRYEIWWLDY